MQKNRGICYERITEVPGTIIDDGNIDMSENIFAQMLQRYSGDPAGWVRDMVGIEVDPGRPR